jgi:hypothetical protein
MCYPLQQAESLSSFFSDEPIMTPQPLLRPWVGAKYNANPEEQNLFLLGESMYSGTDVVPPNLLEQLIAEQIHGGKTWPFYNRVYHTMTGKRRTHSTGDELTAFWNRVALYNYVQFPVVGGPRIRPTHQMWADSQQFFPGVFNELKPDRAIVFGKHLWWRLTLAGFVRATGTEGKILLGTDIHQCPALPIKHPASMGFSAYRWHTDHVSNFLRP